MAAQEFTIASSLWCAEAFDRLADLTRVSEWDRGVTDPRQIEGDGPALGARYEVGVTGFDGEPARVVYELVEYEAPTRFVMIGENEVFRAHDTLVFEPAALGCTLRYVARLDLLGDDPPLTEHELDAVFERVAGVAERGLIAFLNP
jgi:hypothetical protein